jgi:hypothetical protein
MADVKRDIVLVGRVLWIKSVRFSLPKPTFNNPAREFLNLDKSRRCSHRDARPLNESRIQLSRETLLHPVRHFAVVMVDQEGFL